MIRTEDGAGLMSSGRARVWDEGTGVSDSRAPRRGGLRTRRSSSASSTMVAICEREVRSCLSSRLSGWCELKGHPSSSIHAAPEAAWVGFRIWQRPSFSVRCAVGGWGWAEGRAAANLVHDIRHRLLVRRARRFGDFCAVAQLVGGAVCLRLLPHAQGGSVRVSRGALGPA